MGWEQMVEPAVYEPEQVDMELFGGVGVMLAPVEHSPYPHCELQPKSLMVYTFLVDSQLDSR